MRNSLFLLLLLLTLAPVLIYSQETNASSIPTAVSTESVSSSSLSSESSSQSSDPLQLRNDLSFDIFDITNGVPVLPGLNYTNDFRDVTVKTTSPSVTFTISNKGRLPFRITSVTSTGASEFSLTPLKGLELGVDESASFSVKFQPKSKGELFSIVNIQLESTEKNSTNFQFVLIGKGIADTVVMDSGKPQIYLTIPGINVFGDSYFNFDVRAGFRFSLNSLLSAIKDRNLFLGAQFHYSAPANLSNSNVTLSYYNLGGGVEAGYRIPLNLSIIPGMALTPSIYAGFSYSSFEVVTTGDQKLRFGLELTPRLELEQTLAKNFRIGLGVGYNMNITTRFFGNITAGLVVSYIL